MRKKRPRLQYRPPQKVTAPPLSEIWRPDGYVLVSEGVEIIGRAEFGSDWTGMELKARQIASTMPEPNIKFLPDEDGVRRVPDTRIDGWFVQTADGRRVVIRSEQEAHERWREERPKLLEMWRAEYAARKRFDAVVSRVRTELHGGNLHAIALRKRDGTSVKIPAHVWARGDIATVFELGDLDSKWRNPNVINFSAEIGTYGSPVSVEGTALISERELQALLGEKPEHASERETEPDGRKEHTPLRLSPDNPETEEKNKAVVSPQAVPGVVKKSSQKRRKGGHQPGPYYSPLKKFMEMLYNKDLEKFQNDPPPELRRLVEWRFKNDGVRNYPKRSGLDAAIARAKQEIIDSADRNE